MNKTININLAGIIFHLDEEAFKKLTGYLQSIKDRLKGDPGQEEIIADIEARVAELFQEKLGKIKEVIGMADVDEVMSIMGNPEDYETDDEEETTSSSSDTFKNYSTTSHSFGRKLYRNTDDKVFGGVASGLGAYFGIDSVWIRLIWVFLFFTWGTGVLLYIILWIVIPEAISTSQKLQMKGEPINVSNIERSVKNVGEKVGNMATDPKLGNKIGNVIERILNALLSILKFILKFAFKIIGIGLVILGVLILISFLGAIFGHEILIMDNMFGLYDASGYINRMLVVEEHHSLLILGIVMMMIAPVVWLILGGIKLLFNNKTNTRIPLIGSALVSLAGFMIVGYIALSLGRDFRSSASATKVNDIDSISGKVYYLSVNDNRPYETDNLSDELGWTISEDGHFNGAIELSIGKSDKDYAFIKEKYKAKGRTKKDALDRAKGMEYSLEQSDSLILFDDFFKMNSSEKYRNQEMEIVLYIPVGMSIYLDNDMEDIIYDIDNVTNTRDDHMLDHTWLMTQSGLICTDCSSDFFENDSDIESEFEEQWETEAEEMEKQSLEDLQDVERLQQEIEELRRQNERLKKQKSKSNTGTKTRYTENRGFHTPLYVLPVNSPAIVDHNQTYGTQV